VSEPQLIALGVPFDHLVSERKKFRSHIDAKLPRGLSIDDKLELD
jgi:hypothetical protein